MKKIILNNETIIDVSDKETDINVRGDIVFEDNTYIPYEDIKEIL